MIIFKSFENFCGFLFFAIIVLWMIGIAVAMIVYRSDKEDKELEEPEEMQSFIDGIEFAIDNGLYVTQEEFEEYQRVTEKDKPFVIAEDKVDKFLKEKTDKESVDKIYKTADEFERNASKRKR